MTSFNQANYGPRKPVEGRMDSDRNAVITVRVKRSWLIAIGIAAATGGVGGVTGFLKSVSAQDTAESAQTTSKTTKAEVKSQVKSVKKVMIQIDQASFKTLVETVNQLSKNDQTLEKAINTNIDKDDEQDAILEELSRDKPAVARVYKRSKKPSPPRVDTPPIAIPKRIPVPTIEEEAELESGLEPVPTPAPEIETPPRLLDATPEQE